MMKNDMAKDSVEILIVEDSQTQAEKLRYSLESMGYRIRHAKNGIQAMDYLNEYHPALVISDIVMPLMNGYELCKNIKLNAHTRDIPVILMTSLTGIEEVVESLACGADNFITKPYSKSYLLTQIEDFFVNKMLIRSEVTQDRVEISLTNQNRTITVDPQHMFNLLLSTYEAAKEKNMELIKTQDELISINENLEDIVKEKTINLITENKKLIESELTYKALFDYSGVGIAYYTTDGHVISYNEKAAENLGGSSADFERKSLFDLFPREIAERYLDRIKKCASSDKPQNYDDLVQLPTGDLWFFSIYARVLDANGFVKGVQVISNDNSELKEKEKEISYLNAHDQLTGLYNRRFFDEELKRLDSSRNLPLTIAMGDVNGLKLVNDSFGHQSGDQLLICVADILKKACRHDDIIARVGGDEFSIIFPKTNEAEAGMIIQRISNLISQEKIGPLEFSIAFSFATKIAEESIDTIIKKAEDRMYRNKLNDSSSMRNGTIRLIMNTLFEKNSRELKHSERVSSLCVDIATALSFEKNEINHIRSAGLMHDIGKIGIDEYVLNSETRLSDDEWKEVKKHSEIGYRILSSAPDFSDIAEDVFSHHERWDGKGYPRGIAGESISIYARIITIADAFDAMISERAYRIGDKSLRMEEAINEIKKHAGTQFDPVIAKLFVEKVLNVAWS